MSAPAPAAPSVPWYDYYGIPAVPPASIHVFTYTFTSKALEAQVFTHASFVPEGGATTTPDNAQLVWLGASVIVSLSSFLISSRYPTLSSAASADLRAAITSKQFHAHLCRLQHLPTHLHTSSRSILQSDKVLAELLEAYVGAVAQDLGHSRWEGLNRIYAPIVEPFLHAYHGLYQQHRSAPAPQRENRRQELAPYTSRLMEYAAKNRLEPPKFEFESNGAQVRQIVWCCTVVLGGKQMAKGAARSKLEAKHIASAEAMRVLFVTRVRRC
jgi:dsRNA-specific ribonuclease